MTPEQAHRRAILEFCGQAQLLRDVYRVRYIESTFANLKCAFRFIHKSLTFSITFILTLALAIGANTAVF
jgi:hypothetical protein